MRRRTKPPDSGLVRGVLRGAVPAAHHFPGWRTVHSYFAICSEPREAGSLLEQALKNQLGVAREEQGRNASSTFLIVHKA